MCCQHRYQLAEMSVQAAEHTQETRGGRCAHAHTFLVRTTKAAQQLACSAGVPQQVAQRAARRARGHSFAGPSVSRQRRGRTAALIPGNSVAEQIATNGLDSTINIFNIALVGRLLLTWSAQPLFPLQLEASTHFSIIFAFVMLNLRFPNPPGQLVQPLSTICDPYLNLFRGIVPPIGQIDLSPILAFVVLNAAQSTAAALPREMQSRRKGGGGRGLKVSV